jgi:hypothetical protein
MSDEKDPRVLRPAERIEDYAVVLAHANALGGTEAALVALSVEPAEWSRATHWSSAMTREALAGRTELGTAFGATFAAETAAIAARAEAAAKASAAEEPAAEAAPTGGPTVLDVSNAAARDALPSAPFAPPPAAWLEPPRPSFLTTSPASAIAPPPADFDRTVALKVGAPEASAPVLPFRAAPPTPPEDVAVELSDGDLIDDPTVDPLDAATTLDGALPFAASAEDEAPTTRLRSIPPLEDEEVWPALPLPLDRYASLCASLEVHADAHPTVLAQFNVAGPAHLAAIHASFDDLFARDPRMQTTFSAWRADFVARLRSRG